MGRSSLTDITQSDSPVSDKVIDWLVDEPPSYRKRALRRHPETVGVVESKARQELADLSPMGLAQQIDSGYKSRPHLDHLDRVLARAVHRVEAGESVFIRVSEPPRSGKSVLCSQFLPLWLLMRHSSWKIGLVSYSDSLASAWGRQVRRYVEDKRLGLGLDIASDAGAVKDWETTEGGGVTARSIGMGITGRGFKCLHGATAIESEHGPLTIADAYHYGITRVLAYDHESQQAVWRRVEAASRSRRGGLVAITTTAGHRLVCTPDHLIYCGGRYTPAENVREGDTVVGGTVPNPMLVREHSVPCHSGGRPKSSDSGTVPVLLPDVRVASVEQLTGDEWVYDLQVGGTHNLFANGLLVHNCLIIDDAVKDYADAHSEARREALRQWWQTTARTRLEPPSLVLVIGCLVGDTLVLMADGSERPIREVRPGDEVVTFEDGRLSESIVQNWANQGPDFTYTARLESGRVIRANARHPFLIVNSKGEQEWARTDALKPGVQIVSAEGAGLLAPQTSAPARQQHAGSVELTTSHNTEPVAGKMSLQAGGASTEELPVQPMIATAQQSAKVCVRPTTAKHVGLLERIGARLSRTVEHTCDTVTVLNQRTSTVSSPNNTESAQSAADRLTIKTPEVTESCLSTIPTPPETSEGCSATTATSSSVTARRSNGFWLPSSTYALGTDCIVSVERDGYEDVYDIEVEGSHTFVANGLVTHNTRWHLADFTGWVETTGDPFETVEFPAIAEKHDALGRAPGDPLMSPLLEETREEALVRWDSVRKAVGPYAWAALYQQTPLPAEGAVFNIDKFMYWCRDPNLVSDNCVLFDPSTVTGGVWLDSWDLASEAKESADFSVGQRWVKVGADRFLVAQSRAQTAFTETLKEIEAWARPESQFGTGKHVKLRLIEKASVGRAILDTLKRKVAGFVGIDPRGSKEQRARAVTPEIESGNVFIPHPSEAAWVAYFVSELQAFPSGKHDDCVDALSQGLGRLDGETVRSGGAAVPVVIGSLNPWSSV